jgi:hypothetical protein
MKIRVYIDTSVIGGCFDEEFNIWSDKLMSEFISGDKIMILSDTTLRELELAPEKVRMKMNEIYIANATISMVHVLASWNFKHIVNLDRIKKYNGVNLKNGYPVIEIRTPREILKPDEDEN